MANSYSQGKLPKHYGDYSPDYAALVCPLFACGGKRAKNKRDSQTSISKHRYFLKLTHI